MSRIHRMLLTSPTLPTFPTLLTSPTLPTLPPPMGSWLPKLNSGDAAAAPVAPEPTRPNGDRGGFPEAPPRLTELPNAPPPALARTSREPSRAGANPPKLRSAAAATTPCELDAIAYVPSPCARSAPVRESSSRAESSVLKGTSGKASTAEMASTRAPGARERSAAGAGGPPFAAALPPAQTVPIPPAGSWTRAPTLELHPAPGRLRSVMPPLLATRAQRARIAKACGPAALSTRASRPAGRERLEPPGRSCQKPDGLVS